MPDLQAARVGDWHACPSVEPCPTSHVGGMVQKGSTDVAIEDQDAARVDDPLECKAGGPDEITQGAATVFVNDKYVARDTSETDHDGRILGHAEDVWIGGPSIRIRKPRRRTGEQSNNRPGDKPGNRDRESAPKPDSPTPDENKDATQHRCTARIILQEGEVDVTHAQWISSIGELVALRVECDCDGVQQPEVQWSVPKCNVTDYNPEAAACALPGRLTLAQLTQASLPPFAFSVPGPHSVSVSVKCSHGTSDVSTTVTATAPAVALTVRTDVVRLYEKFWGYWVCAELGSGSQLDSTDWTGDGRVLWGRSGIDGMQYSWSPTQPAYGECALVQVIRSSEINVNGVRSSTNSMSHKRDGHFRFRESGAEGDSPGMPLDSTKYKKMDGRVEFEQWLFWRDGNGLWMPIATSTTSYTFVAEFQPTGNLLPPRSRWHLLSRSPRLHSVVKGIQAYDTFPWWDDTHYSQAAK